MLEKLKFSKYFKLILTAIFYLCFAFAMVLLKEFGAVLLLILGLIYFYTKKIGQELLIFLTLISSTNVLEFFNVDLLPFIQLGPGLRFNAIDLLVLPISFRSYIALKIKNIKPKSENFILFLLILSIIYVTIGFILTGSPKEAGFNFLRVLFYPFFYFALLYYFIEERNRDRFFIILTTIVIIATLIQIYEFILDYRLIVPGFAPMNEAYTESGVRIFTASGERLYLWNRATGLLFFVTILAFSFLFYKINKNNFSLITSLFGILGLLIATVRVWMVILVFSVVILLVIIPRKTKIALNVVIISLLTVLLSYQLTAMTYAPGKVDLLSSLFGRAASIINPQSQYGEQNTFIVRIIVNQKNLLKFAESPIWGHGFGQYIYNNYYNNDVGITNRLVQFGLLGTLPLLIYILTYSFSILRAFKLNIINDIKNRAILAGIFAILIGHLPAYIWQLDFWGPQLVFVMILCFALGDSLFISNLSLNNRKNYSSLRI